MHPSSGSGTFKMTALSFRGSFNCRRISSVQGPPSNPKGRPSSSDLRLRLSVTEAMIPNYTQKITVLYLFRFVALVLTTMIVTKLHWTIKEQKKRSLEPNRKIVTVPV
jgi:hypothetical protein